MKKSLWIVIFLWLLAPVTQAGASLVELSDIYTPSWWNGSYDDNAVSAIGSESNQANGSFVNSSFTDLPPGVESVSVTFFTEGASLHNALGWFTYDEGNNVLSSGTIFSDASTNPDLLGLTDGPLQPGDTLDVLFSEPLANSFGFWISADGSGEVFYSVDALNDDGEDHLGAMTLNGVPGYVIGFEDMYGLGDADYNDVIISYESNLDTAPVPEPATMFLLGSGLLGALGFSRSCRKKILK